jgi:type I restriction enzyme S subunit
VSAVLAPALEPWPMVSLSHVADLVRGVSYPKADAREEPAAGYVPVLRATNIQDARLILDSDLVFVAERNVSSEQLLRPGDIVVATSSGSKHLVGKSGQLYSPWNGSFGAFCAAVRPKPRINPRYLALFLQAPAYWRQITKKALGVNINNLRRGDLETLELPLPPPDVQSNVVAEIEKQFSRLDEAVANLKRVKANLKRYKAAVLKAAVEGRLAPTEAELARREGRSYEAGTQLLQRVLNARRNKGKGNGPYKGSGSLDPKNQPALPEGWGWATLGQLADVVRGASPRPAGDSRYFGGAIPWITVGPITADEGIYLHSVPATLTEEGATRSRFIQPHTLLLTNSGATLGVPKITLIGGCINDGVAALLDVDYPLKLYLLYFLRTLTQTLRGIDQGAAQPNLNTSIIKGIWVPLPPLVEQERIVAELGRRLSLISNTEGGLEANGRRANQLRASVLSAAFTPRSIAGP